MQNIDWANLTFGYYPTNYNVRCYFRNGKWGELEVSSDTSINIHMAATCLHYGQEAFEGMKAFRGKDGKVRVFRWDENCKRLGSRREGYPSQRRLHPALRDWRFALSPSAADRHGRPRGCETR